jgi:DNA polymerase III epsilon subunit-like protein
MYKKKRRGGGTVPPPAPMPPKAKALDQVPSSNWAAMSAARAAAAQAALGKGKGKGKGKGTGTGGGPSGKGPFAGARGPPGPRGPRGAPRAAVATADLPSGDIFKRGALPAVPTREERIAAKAAAKAAGGAAARRGGKPAPTPEEAAAAREASARAKRDGTKKGIPMGTVASLSTPIVALDCEMVGVGASGKRSALARASLVDGSGAVLLDTYVKVDEPVTDYRTQWSGVRPKNLVGAPTFREVQRSIAGLIDGKLLVGHALKNDLDALMLEHPRSMLRDTARYRPLKNGKRSASLKALTKKFLEEDIQGGEHSSVVDARAALGVYLQHRSEWETSLRGKGGLALNAP